MLSTAIEVRTNSNISLWTPTYGHTSVGQPAKTYFYLLCINTGCCLEESKESMLSLYPEDDEKAM